MKSKSEYFGYSDKLPPEERDIFMWLCQELSAITGKWDFFITLFGNEGNIVLFNELAPVSFHIIEESIRNDLILSIYRLSEPSTSHGKSSKANLSLLLLAEKYSSDSKIASLTIQFKAECKPIRQYRNKRIGHNDLAQKLDPKNNPLKRLGRNTFDKPIDTATKILQQIIAKHDNVDIRFTPIAVRGGADQLLFYLKEARNLHKEYFDKE